MPNEKNVEALARLLVEMFQERPAATTSPKEAGEWLAARGVLVPSALTDEEAHDIRPGVFGLLDVDRTWEGHAGVIRETLERIAKGETA